MNVLKRKHTRNQRGVILIVAILFTVAMSIVVLGMAQSSILEERVTSNTLNAQVALQAAEAIIRDAEVNAFTGAPMDPFDPQAFVDDCVNGYCLVGINADERWLAHPWDQADRVLRFADGGSELNTVENQPVYFIEYVEADGSPSPNNCPKLTFRMVGRGVAADGAQSFVEVMYKFRPLAFKNGAC